MGVGLEFHLKTTYQAMLINVYNSVFGTLLAVINHLFAPTFTAYMYLAQLWRHYKMSNYKQIAVCNILCSCTSILLKAL